MHPVSIRLLRFTILLFFAPTIGCVGISTIPEINTAELLAEPQTWNGKMVRLHGHIDYGFENCKFDYVIWYWPKDKTCYGADSHLDAWSGNGTLIGTVRTDHHGHLGVFPFALVDVRTIRDR